MKHVLSAAAAYLLCLTNSIVCTDSTIVQFVQLSSNDYPKHKMWTEDTRLVRAVERNEIANARWLADTFPTLLHKWTTYVGNTPVHVAKTVSMAKILVDRKALINKAEVITLLHSAMDRSVDPDVVALYLDEGLTPLCKNNLGLTPLMILALRSYSYKRSENCVKKAELLLGRLQPNQITALFDAIDLAGGRNVFDCIEQVRQEETIPELSNIKSINALDDCLRAYAQKYNIEIITKKDRKNRQL